MLNLARTDLKRIYESAVRSAELLRQAGETAKAARVESLAKILAGQLREPIKPADE